MRAYSNRHHGVPRSFLGSTDALINLTDLDKGEHARFHEFAGHPPPDFFVRRAILSLADWEDEQGKILSAPLYEAALEALTARTWHELYLPGAIRSHPRGDEEKITYARTAIHICDHLSEETYAVSDARTSVLTHSNIAPHRYAFREQMTAFFGQDNPVLALRQYLTDKNEMGDLKWVKPLQPAIRSRLLSLLKPEEFVKDTAKVRKEIDVVMQDHRARIDACVKVWEPNVIKYEPTILQHRSIPMFWRYLSRERSA